LLTHCSCWCHHRLHLRHCLHFPLWRWPRWCDEDFGQVHDRVRRDFRIFHGRRQRHPHRCRSRSVQDVHASTATTDNMASAKRVEEGGMSCFGQSSLDFGRSSVYRLAGSQGVKYGNTFVTSLRSSDITESILRKQRQRAYVAAWHLP